MRRESDDGFLCGVCLETVYRGECRCQSLDEELLFCEHPLELRKINLATAMVECSACGEQMFDLNPQLSPVLRVARL